MAETYNDVIWKVVRHSAHRCAFKSWPSIVSCIGAPCELHCNCTSSSSLRSWRCRRGVSCLFCFPTMDSFAASPLGKEFFRRLWLSSHCRQCASTHLSSPSFVDIVLSNEFHSFIVDLCLSRSIFVSSAVVDPVSRSLESPRSFGCLSSSSSLVDRCLTNVLLISSVVLFIALTGYFSSVDLIALFVFVVLGRTLIGVVLFYLL